MSDHIKQVRCVLEQITLKRGKFTLHVPELELATEIITAPEGKVVTRLPFVGKSGAGKSTLLNILAGIEWPHTGEVHWWFPDGTDAQWGTNGLSASRAGELRRRHFGYAFQSSTLIPHLTVGDNLCYPLLFRGYSRDDAWEEAYKILSGVLHDDEKNEDGHVDELLRRFPSKLSGGQLQRVALAQSFIHNPHILFADEPTGSLDRETRKQVMDKLYAWVNDPEYHGKRLLIWVTHHENDPRDAQVQWKLEIDSGQCTWNDNIYEPRKEEHVSITAP